MSEPIALVPTKPDAEVAQAFRQELIEAYAPVIEIFQRAKDQGFLINAQVGPGPLGRIALMNVQIVKEF